jgi:hypothetical protein
VKNSSPTRSSKTSPTRSRSSHIRRGLLTLSAALLLAAAPAPPLQQLTSVPTRDQKIVRRWQLAGDPRGLAVGRDGTLYVGLAQPQAVIAVDSKTGAVKKRVVLDSAEIAATKELVTIRLTRDGSRLVIANGSDESATILSLPDLGVIREITLEGEEIRDAVPDPKGRYLYLLGRRVHVFDFNGEHELHTLPLADPMAIAAGNDHLAVLFTEDFGTAKATSAALYDTAAFNEVARDPLETTDKIEGALFGGDEREIVAISREHLFEKPLVRTAKTMTKTASGQMKMSADFGDFVNSDRICLPEGAGPQIMALAPNDLLLYAERRCTVSGAFTGSSRRISPASLYGVAAYAVGYDPSANTLAVTDRAGFLTIYKVPRAVSVK